MTLKLRRENGHKFSYVHYMLFSTSFKEIAVAFKLGMPSEKTFPLGASWHHSQQSSFFFLSWRLILKGIELSWVPPASDELSDWSIRRDTFRSCPTQAQQLYSTQSWKERHFNSSISGHTKLHTLPTSRRYIYALHIFLYFQPWIFTQHEPRLCPSSESSGWLKTLSSAVLHLEKIDKGAKIGATLIESFFYCYCVENRFVMSTVVPDTAVLSLFFFFSSSLPFFSLISLSLSESVSSSTLPHRDQRELSP